MIDRPPQARTRPASRLRTGRPSGTTPDGRRLVPAGKALAVVLIALSLGALMNIQTLREAADRQPFGFKRDVSMVLVWPLEQLSVILGLDEPRELLDARLGRGDADADDPAGAVPDAADEVAQGGADPDAEALPDPDAEALPDPDAEAVPPADPTTEATPDAPTRTFSATDPLSIWVVGDSLTEQIGPAIRDRTGRPGVAATTEHEFHYSSGLTRPDFFDWQAQVEQLRAQHDPDVWVAMYGANDAQDIRSPDGRFLPLGSEEWEAIYRDRVGALMDAMIGDGQQVIWIGQPIMRSAEFDERMQYLNSLYAAEAGERDQVIYLDTVPLFATPEGAYADYLPVEGGQLAQMRLSDGIHLTRAGAERVATAVLGLLPDLTASGSGP